MRSQRCKGFTVFKGLEGFKRLEGLEGFKGFTVFKGLAEAIDVAWWLQDRFDRGKRRRRSSTPAVVPGAAPALAKAGVGGFNECDFMIYTGYWKDARRLKMAGAPWHQPPGIPRSQAADFRWGGRFPVDPRSSSAWVGRFWSIPARERVEADRNIPFWFRFIHRNFRQDSAQKRVTTWRVFAKPPTALTDSCGPWDAFSGSSARAGHPLKSSDQAWNCMMVPQRWLCQRPFLQRWRNDSWV